MSRKHEAAAKEHYGEDKLKPYEPHKPAVYFIALVMAISMIAAGAVFYKIRYEPNPLVRESGLLQSQKFYDLSIYSNPEINSAGHYGSENAGVTIVAFLDMHSDASKYFMKEIFPKIKEEHIDTGNAKYYHKSYITIGSINKKDADFEYSIALACIKKISAEKYYDVYFSLFSSPGSNMRETLINHNIPMDKYQDCLEEKGTIDGLYRDAMEIENLGIVGIGQRFYVGIAGTDNTVLDGIPGYAKFNRTIRQYGIQLGN